MTLNLAEAREWMVEKIGPIPGVVVYPSPPEQIKTPCVIIMADQPWLEAGTLTQRHVHMKAVCCAGIKGGNEGALERLEPLVALAIQRLGCTAAIDSPMADNIAGSDVLYASVPVTLKVEE